MIDGVRVRIYSPAKTIVDCFKFRNKVGQDVVLEALREGWRARKVTMKDLVYFSGSLKETMDNVRFG